MAFIPAIQYHCEELTKMYLKVNHWKSCDNCPQCIHEQSSDVIFIVFSINQSRIYTEKLA